MFASDLQNTQGSAWGRTLPTVARELQAEKHGSAKAPNHYSCQAAPKLFSWQHAATPDLTVVTDAYTTTGHGTGRVLRVNCNFTNPADPWLRLTTSGAPNWPDPVIDFTRKPQFDLYADKSVKVAVGCRETTTAAGTPVGSDGGTSGAIEWAGVTNISGTAPMPTRTVATGAWTTLTFDLPNEPIRNFSLGNGVLSTASGLGVLEHLAIVPTAGTGTNNLYLDNFAVLRPRSFTYSLAAGAPADASVNPTTGVFTWTPTDAQGPSTNSISVIVTDNSSPPVTDTRTFTVTVLARPSVQSVAFANGSTTLTWNAGAGVTYRVQFKDDLAATQWTNLPPDVTAAGPAASFTEASGVPQRFYRILVLN